MTFTSRLKTLSALGCAGIAAAVLSAPAQAAVPSASDFEQRIGGSAERVSVAAEGKRSGEREAAWRSDPIVAPRRFDFAGLTREMRHYELRARDAGGEWSEWVETGSGDPVYFGGADELQVRTHGFRPSGKVHYVSVSTPRGSIPALARASAKRDTPKPDIVKRRAWGAEGRGGCEPRKRPDEGKVKAAVIHHTVNANNYSRREAAGLVLGICRFHRNGNGWDDIGYNALVDRFGTIYEGRDGGLLQPVVGAHALGFNDQTTGVAALGTYSSTRVSKQTKRGIAQFLAWKLDFLGLKPTDGTTLKSGGGDQGTNRWPKNKRVPVEVITKHRRLGHTDCPGDFLNREIDSIQQMTKRKMR